MSTLDLGLIGNCSISVLIDKQARVVWWCLPRYDGDPVFHALLGSRSGDPADGAFTIEIEGQVRTEQSSVTNTAILSTRLYAEDGTAIEIIDHAPRFEARGRTFRPTQFVRQVRQEVSRVTWASRKETAVATLMVFIMVLLASVFFFVVDQVLAWGVQLVLGLGG